MAVHLREANGPASPDSRFNRRLRGRSPWATPIIDERRAPRHARASNKGAMPSAPVTDVRPAAVTKSGTTASIYTCPCDHLRSRAAPRSDLHRPRTATQGDRGIPSCDNGSVTARPPVPVHAAVSLRRLRLVVPEGENHESQDLQPCLECIAALGRRGVGVGEVQDHRFLIERNWTNRRATASAAGSGHAGDCRHDSTCRAGREYTHPGIRIHITRGIPFGQRCQSRIGASPSLDRTARLRLRWHTGRKFHDRRLGMWLRSLGSRLLQHCGRHKRERQRCQKCRRRRFGQGKRKLQCRKR